MLFFQWIEINILKENICHKINFETARCCCKQNSKVFSKIILINISFFRRLSSANTNLIYKNIFFFFFAGYAWLIIPGGWAINLYPGLVYKPWRLYYGATGVPCLLSAFFIYFLPESPKFLIAKGEIDKAIKVLKRIHKMNNKNTENEFWVRTAVFLALLYK